MARYSGLYIDHGTARVIPGRPIIVTDDKDHGIRVLQDERCQESADIAFGLFDETTNEMVWYERGTRMPNLDLTYSQQF
jgi:hypothetical protein